MEILLVIFVVGFFVACWCYGISLVDTYSRVQLAQMDVDEEIRENSMESHWLMVESQRELVGILERLERDGRVGKAIKDNRQRNLRTWRER